MLSASYIIKHVRRLLVNKIQMKMSPLGWVAFVLTIIGGLNWGLIGAFGFDLVASIFGAMSVTSRVIYVLVGLSAIYMLVEGLMKTKAPAVSAPQM